MECPDKMWSAGEGTGNPLQYSCLRNLMDSKYENGGKRKKKLEEEPPGQKVSNMLLEKSGGQLTIGQERMKPLG